MTDLTPEQREELRRPVDDMSRAVASLALEVPATVWEDVHRRWQRVVDALDAREHELAELRSAGDFLSATQRECEGDEADDASFDRLFAAWRNFRAALEASEEEGRGDGE